MNLRRFYLKESIRHLMYNQGSCEIPLINKRLITTWLKHMYPMEGALRVSHDGGVTYDFAHGGSFDRNSAERNSCIKNIVYRNMNYKISTVGASDLCESFESILRACHRKGLSERSVFYPNSVLEHTNPRTHDECTFTWTEVNSKKYQDALKQYANRIATYESFDSELRKKQHKRFIESLFWEPEPLTTDRESYRRRVKMGMREPGENDDYNRHRQKIR